MQISKLLSRDNFREGVFSRDKHRCVFCELPAVDAHHIFERRLWDDGGYYLENGASVCEKHHLECEMTLISVEDVREACGITKIIVPDILYEDQMYDKWGNPVLSNGHRTRGPLFYDENVQKILKEGNVLEKFVSYVKASRTMHLPWSPGIHDDDRIIKNLDAFHDQEVVVTIKFDGENTSMYSDYFHARSIDGRSHPSRSWAKSKWGQICGDIPKGWRVCGENVYATHSIHYTDLEDYFYGFGIWNEHNIRLDWDDQLEWFKLLNITPVTELYRGLWDEKKIKSLWDEKNHDTMEGYVVTTVKGFPYGQYHKNVAKFVRKGHVQTNKHWMHGQRIIPNELRKIDNEDNNS
jgi:hypothetical protein